ncbi:MAG: mono/diheme cytochrome c family protein, partial [Akkermansiaceae bacterium]
MTLIRSCFLLLVSFTVTTVVSAKEPFEAFLETHCASCHGPDKKK